MSTIAKKHNPASLPFVERGESCCNWKVDRSGNHAEDYTQGRRFARLMVQAVRNKKVSTCFLREVLRGMPEDLESLEAGFIYEIMNAAAFR